MAIAPPGSMKSELVTALDGLRNVHMIDAVTSKTFISGQIIDGSAAQSPSLLHRIGNNGMIVCSDFSTILSIKPEERNGILADLRKIFDGYLTKQFGTSEPVARWDGRITLIVAVTPKIDHFGSVIQSLGDRFVRVRWHRGGFDAALQAMSQDVTAAKNSLKQAVHVLIEGLPHGEITLPSETRKRIVAVAEIAVIARTPVERGLDKRIIEVGEPESPTRLAQQLGQLAMGSARLEHRDVVNETDFDLVRRCGLDCIPINRLAIFEQIRHNKPISIPDSTKSYVVGELAALKMVDGDHLTPLTEDLFASIDQTEGFTRQPPHTNDRTTRSVTREVGGHSGEAGDNMRKRGSR